MHGNGWTVKIREFVDCQFIVRNMHFLIEDGKARAQNEKEI